MNIACRNLCEIQRRSIHTRAVAPPPPLNDWQPRRRARYPPQRSAPLQPYHASRSSFRRAAATRTRPGTLLAPVPERPGVVGYPSRTLVFPGPSRIQCQSILFWTNLACQDLGMCPATATSATSVNLLERIATLARQRADPRARNGFLGVLERTDKKAKEAVVVDSPVAGALGQC
jgi:hypothetical protein